MIIGYPGEQNITGFIPIVPAISKATVSELHISLSNAIATAERSVGTNAHVVFARLGLIHGFLMYTILVTDTKSNLHYVKVDVVSATVDNGCNAWWFNNDGDGPNNDDGSWNGNDVWSCNDGGFYSNE